MGIRKKFCVILMLFSILVVGCSNKNKQTANEISSNTSQESKKEKEELSQLKDLYSKKQYLSLIRAFNESKITNSKELNKIYNQAFEALYQEKQYATLELLTNYSNSNIILEPISERNLEKYEAAWKEYEKGKQQNQTQNTINRIVEYIDAKYYDDGQKEGGQETDNVEIQTLHHYAAALADYEETKDLTGENFVNSLTWIEPNYNGVKSAEIKQFIHKFFTDEEWKQLHDQAVIVENNREEIQKIIEENENKPLPTIGMTSDEVLASKWGKPSETNKTTTANTISEQWVYYSTLGKTKYIYLENGVVTSIQE